MLGRVFKSSENEKKPPMRKGNGSELPTVEISLQSGLLYAKKSEKVVSYNYLRKLSKVSISTEFFFWELFFHA